MPTTQFSCDSIIVSVFWVERYFLPHIPFYKKQIGDFEQWQCKYRFIGKLKRKKLIQNYRVWEFMPVLKFFCLLMADLSYQTAQKVLNADPEEQIKVLQDYSQNFPSRTRYTLITFLRLPLIDKCFKNLHV